MNEVMVLSPEPALREDVHPFLSYLLLSPQAAGNYTGRLTSGFRPG